MTDIVITGIGTISAMGIGRDNFWHSCCQAQSGIKPVQEFISGEFRSPLAAWVDGFNPKQYLKPSTYRRMSRIARITASVAVEAFQNSGLDLDQIDTDRVAVVVGTAHGSSASIEDFYVSLLTEGPRGAQPFYFPETVPNALAGHVSMVLGVTGPNTTFGQNDISAESALVYALRLLHQNQIDAAVVCGADEISAMLFNCYDATLVLNPGFTAEDNTIQPQMAGGMVLGEGAGALILERAEHAARRKARIYVRLLSGVITGGPAEIGTYDHCAEPLQQAIGQTLEQAGLRPDQINQICTAANFTGDLEQVEAQALEQSLGHNAAHVTPLRYLSGSFGGAGILSAAAMALSLTQQRALPAVKAHTLATASKLPLWYFDRTARPQNGLITACTYGGGCAALILAG